VKSYVALVRLPPARRLIYALSAACLSFGMVSLTVLLAVERATGSYADGGFAVAAFSIGAGASAPFRGRLIDRHGRRWLLAFALGFAASLVALDVAARLGAATWVLIALAAATGVTAPPLFASARAAWSLVVDPAFVRPGYAVTSLLGDVGQVTGPVLAAALYVATDWAAPLVCAATAVVAAALSVPRAEHLPGPIAPRPMPSIARSRALRGLLAVSVMLGIAVGLVQVAVPALAGRWHAGSLAGLLLAAFAFGSVAGALWYGARRWRRPVVDRYLTAVLVLGALLAPAALAGGPSSLAAALLLAGIAFGPATVSLFETLDVLAPGSGAEALTWVTTAEATGGAAGAALAGIVLRLGGWAPFALASVVLVIPLAPALAARTRRVRGVAERARA
jgi:MFS family permease